MTRDPKSGDKPRTAKSTPPGAPAPRGEKLVKRPEASGHMDPGHAARLLRLSRETDTRDTNVGFVAGPRSGDPMAEQLGEEAVSAMTGGDSVAEEDRDEHTEEEDGGPFVETSGEEEFATGTDDSNVPDATREPFPKTSGGR